MPFQVSLGDSESASRWVLESLVSGQVIRNVRATVCGTEDFDEDNDFGARCVWMKDLEFDVDKPNVPLPSFDADAISVSELVELLKRNGNMLSSGQLRELQHRLAGRRLAFRGLEVDNDWMQDTEFVCKSVGLALLVGWKDRVWRRRDLMSEQTVEATVAAEPCSRWNGSLAIRLVDGKLGSATGD